MDTQGLTGLAQAVIEAAREGLEQSMLPDRAGALREVAEGLGDGLATASDALRLTLVEAKGCGQRFAREDLDRIVRDIQSLGGMFVSTFTEAAKRLGTAAASEGRTFKEHMERTYQRIRPSLESALSAAKEQPLALGKETLQAGFSAGTQAAGTLFSEVGKRLQRIGQRLQGGRQR